MTTPMSPESVPPSAAPVPDASAVRRPSSLASLLLVCVAVVGGAAGTFLFLGAHPSAGTAAAASAEGRAGSSGAAPAAAAETAGVSVPAHQWSREDEYRWIANHRRSVAYELDANQQVKAWTTHVRPTLVMRCLNRKTEVFVYTETPSKMESTDGLHSVRLTFDDGVASVERWPDSAEHDALFAPDGTGLARRIAAARHLRFGFSPHNAEPAQVDFDLGDSSAVVAHLAKTCGWK